jgi:hypothetical protein
MIKEIGNYLKNIFLSIINQWKQRLTERVIESCARFAATAVSFIFFLVAYIFLMVGIALLINECFEFSGIGFIITGIFQMLLIGFLKNYFFIHFSKVYAKIITRKEKQD